MTDAAQPLEIDAARDIASSLKANDHLAGLRHFKRFSEFFGDISRSIG